MAKSLSPAKQLESAARIAIVLLPLGSEERIALARALNTLCAPKPPKADKIHKYDYCLKMHDEHCHCVACTPKRDRERAAYALVNGLMLSVGTIAPWRWHDAFASQYESKKDASARLSKCACEHDADQHLEDANANLLKCQADGCECDHFRYEIPGDRKDNGRRIGELKQAA
jgi:hypothetical protein